MLGNFLEIAQDATFFDVSIGEQLLRVLAATLAGAVFGFEREVKGKPAGFVTFMIVSMGACLIALLQINTINMIIEAIGDNPNLKGILSADLTRIIAQVVSGIGFLGAGTILYSKGSIKGITTAAMLWVAAGLGLLIGIGGRSNYIIAGCTTIMFIPLLVIMRFLGRRAAEKFKVHRIFVVFEETREHELYDAFAEQGAIIKKTFFHNKFNKNGMHLKEVYIYFTVSKKYDYSEIVSSISEYDWVYSLEEA